MPFIDCVDGRKLYYVDEGRGQTYVFLHDWADDSDVFDNVSKELNNRYRCVRYDLWGHKRSTSPETSYPGVQNLAAELDELLTALRVKKPIVVGVSLGALVLLEYVRMYGNKKIQSCILTDLSFCVMRRQKSQPLLYETETLELVEQKRLLPHDDVEALLYEHFRNRMPEAKETAIREAVRDRMRNCNTQVLRSLHDSMIHTNVKELLQNLVKPVAVFESHYEVFQEEGWDDCLESLKCPFMRRLLSTSVVEEIKQKPKTFSGAMEAFSVFTGTFQPMVGDIYDQKPSVF